MKKHFIAVTLATVLAGCSSAQKSSEVQATRAPVAPYLKMSCSELATEQSVLVREAEAARGSVDKAYDSDKTVEVVTWILFFPAALALEGNQEEAAKLASIKGQMEAVTEAQKINQCMSS